MKNKVLFTASTASHIRQFHLPYLRWFQDRGWEVHAACGAAEGEIPFADETIPLPFEKRMTSPKNFQAARILRTKIRREDYALITTHTALAAFFTRLALSGLRERPPVACMVHGYLFDDGTGYIKKQILLAAERLTAPSTDLLLTMNQWDLETARRCKLGARVAGVPGVGVDFSRLEQADPARRLELRRELGLPEKSFILIYPAEFSARKSQSVLIRAMEHLPENVTLVLAGRGAMLEECRTLARSLGAERRIVFPGHVSDMSRWYGAADAAVSASRSEGLPFNIMEAMYTGLPVIASAVKGHTDLIREGETGMLYPYGGAEACARAVRRLLEDPDAGAAMAARAREYVAQYDIARVQPVVLEQYESLLTPVSV